MRTILLSVLVGISLSSHSQSFISESKLWSQVACGTEYGSAYRSSHIKMTNDTLIDDLLYKRAYISEDELQQKWSLTAFVRETDTGTVFIRKVRWDHEELLLDFGVEEGDSIEAPYSPFPYFYVDSTRNKPFGIYKERRKHIYLSVDHEYNDETWIQGVGSMNGVLSELSFIRSCGEFRSLLCFSENDSLKYVHEYYNTCFKTGNFYYSNRGKEFESIHTETYPNPASSSLTIEFDNPEYKQYQLTINDNLGRQITPVDKITDNQVELDVQQYQPGLYYYRLMNEERKKGSCGKFVVE